MVALCVSKNPSAAYMAFDTAEKVHVNRITRLVCGIHHGLYAPTHYGFVATGKYKDVDVKHG
jgi:hypothetical protein